LSKSDGQKFVGGVRGRTYAFERGHANEREATHRIDELDALAGC
jgi:hypothetical protein